MPVEFFKTHLRCSLSKLHIHASFDRTLRRVSHLTNEIFTFKIRYIEINNKTLRKFIEILLNLNKHKIPCRY